MKNILKYTFLITIFSLITLGFFIYSANAQFSFDERFISVTEQDITIRSNPEFPKSNETVVVTLNSYAVNLNRLRITWFLNGQIAQSGLGETTFTYTGGGVNRETVIDIYIQVSPDRIIRKQAVFNYGDLDLVWEAIDSYLPPFSKLRRLPARESIVKIVAIPDSSQISISDLEKDLVYNWQKNDQNQPNNSGFGRNIFLMRNDILEESETLSVTAINKNGNVIGRREIEIDFVEPRVMLYSFVDGQKRPVFGNYIIHDSQTGPLRLVAEPIYFSAKPFTINFIDFEWRISGELFKNPEPNYNTLDLDLEPGFYVGTLKVSHPLKLMQFARELTFNIEVR